MYEILAGSSGKVVGVKLSEKITDADYKGFVPKIEEVIKKEGSARVLCELIHVTGFECKAMWDEIKFDAKHHKDVEACAVVGDKKWEEWMLHLCRPFTKAKIEYFPANDLEKAWTWIRGK